MSVVTPTILSMGKPMPVTYEVVSLEINRAVNRIPTAQIVLLDGDAAQQIFAVSDSDFFEPGKEIEIKLRYEGAPQDEATVFRGLVVGQRVEAGRQGMLLTVELKDAAVKLTTARKSEIFRDQTDDKIISAIITGRGLKTGKISATPVTHAQLVQYYCTDWDFILTRAEAQGLLVVVDDGEISLAEIVATGPPVQKFEFGMSEIYNLEFEADAGHQLSGVQSVAWDAKLHTLTQAATAVENTPSPGNLHGHALATALGTEATVQTNPVPLPPKELQAWSDGALARSRLSLIRGHVETAGLGKIKLLDVVEIAGVGDRFNGKTPVTALRHRLDGDGWRTQIHVGLASARFATRPQIADVPAAGLLPGVNGLQIAIVDAFEEDPDKEFRVKVRLPGIDPKAGSLWARLATPDAGNERGYFFRPEPDDEVIVGFLNDDPRQAVILGALFSAKNAPPKSVATLSQENVNKAIVSKKGTTIRFVDDEKASLVIETAGGNQVLLDDDKGQIRLADQHGNTIVMDEEGIVIKSAKKLTLEADGDLEIKAKGAQLNASGNVAIKGAKVDIK